VTGRTVGLTLLCVALIAIGQLLFKAAATEWRAEPMSAAGLAQLLSARMLVALVVYGVATLLWVYVLRSAELSAAYLLFSLAFVIVPVLAHYAFGEPLRANTLVGGAVIVAGIVIATR
jgi:drug/metabolite transporter (DMT)-like permease